MSNEGVDYCTYSQEHPKETNFNTHDSLLKSWTHNLIFCVRFVLKWF